MDSGQNYSGFVLLPQEVLRDHQETVKCLARDVTVLSPTEEYPVLISAVENGNYDVFEVLLEGKGDMTRRIEGFPALAIFGDGNNSVQQLFPTLPMIYSERKPETKNLQRICDARGRGGSSGEILRKIYSGNVFIDFIRPRNGNFSNPRWARTHRLFNMRDTVPGEKGDVFLHIAASKDDTALLTLAFDLGIGIDVQTATGHTALHAAVLVKGCKAVRFLLGKGANVEMTNNDHRTPLHLATTKNAPNIVFDLLIFGAKIDGGNAGDTALNAIGWWVSFVKSGQLLLDYDFNSSISASNYPKKFSPSGKQAVEKQAIKLSVLGFKVASTFASVQMQTFQERRFQVQSSAEFREKCVEEVVRLKEQRIGDSSVSFFDVATKGVHQNSCYARNADFIQIVKKGDLSKRFPIYASLILCEFEKGLWKRKLLDKGVEALSSLATKFSCLPFEVKEKIVGYLTLAEILKFLNTSF